MVCTHIMIKKIEKGGWKPKIKKVDVKFCKAMARSLGILKEWWDNWVLESEKSQ